MRREWTIWLGFTAVVLVAVVFVVTRDDNTDSSKLSAGTSVPTTVRVVLSTVTTKPPVPTTSTTPTSSTTVVVVTAPPTTARSTATPATNATVPVTQPPVTVPPTTAPPVTEPPLKPSFGPGTYRINIDLPPGTYRSEGGSNCSWARLSTVTANPTPADVIASGYSTGAPITVVIAPSDAAFTTSYCAIWLGQ